MRPQPAKIALLTSMIVICLGLGLLAGCTKDNRSSSVKFTVLQTSDVHHHAAGVGPQSDYTPLDTSDNDSVLGGYARLAALIDGVRDDADARGEQVLLFDSGDFMMGTIYDLTADDDPAAFQFMNSMGYDAVTLGNHEFDWGLQGLSGLIDAALDNGFSVPIVASNMITSPDSGGDDDIEALVADNVIVGSTIIPISDGVKVGVLGILGPDAVSVAPLTSPVTFNNEYAFLQGKVDALKAAGADIVVLLSHTGVSWEGTGEDVLIAENVTGIDIILSGHTHVTTQEALVKGASGTLIVAPGSYGADLSRLDITYSKRRGQIVDYSFELLPVDDTVAGDSAVNDMVQAYQPVIDTALESLGVNATTVVSGIGFDLEKAELEETAFGDLVADALRQAANDLDTASSDPYDLAVIASGGIRDNIYQGKTGDIIFSDVYNALPLGSSPYDDAAPGYPLMSVYVTAPEIRNICEIAISVAPLLGDDFYLNFSGIRYDYDLTNAFLTSVTDVSLCDSMNTETSPCTTLDLSDESTLYHLAVNLYALSMMDLATDFGLPIIPKDQVGIEVDSSEYADFRIDTSSDLGIQELKEWRALWYFLETFYPPEVGIPAAIYDEDEDGTGLGRATLQ